MKIIKSRITGGILRGRELLSPESEKTHPMGSRERLAILNMIGPDVVDSRILDLFAGTGALGIEALSRGAKEAVFIEKNHKTAEILRKNIQNLKLENQAKIIEEDAELAEFEDDFDFVFIDPPYDKIDEFNIESIVQKYSHAKKIILSHPKESFYHLEGFEERTKTYAGASITIFTNAKS